MKFLFCLYYFLMFPLLVSSDLYSDGFSSGERLALLQKLLSGSGKDNDNVRGARSSSYISEVINSDVIDDKISGIYDKIEEMDNKLNEIHNSLFMLESLLSTTISSIASSSNGSSGGDNSLPIFMSKGVDVGKECLASPSYSAYSYALKEFQDLSTSNASSVSEKVRPMENFISSNSESPCVVSANFWIGELFWDSGENMFAEGNFKESLERFKIAASYSKKSNRVHSNYRTPIRIMKTVIAHKNMNKVEDSCKGLLGLKKTWSSQGYDKFFDSEIPASLKDELRAVKRKIDTEIAVMSCGE